MAIVPPLVLSRAGEIPMHHDAVAAAVCAGAGLILCAVGLLGLVRERVLLGASAVVVAEVLVFASLRLQGLGAGTVLTLGLPGALLAASAASLFRSRRFAEAAFTGALAALALGLAAFATLVLWMFRDLSMPNLGPR